VACERGMWRECLQVALAVAVSSATGASAAASTAATTANADRHFRARRAERHRHSSHGGQVAASFLALGGRQVPPGVETVSLANLTEPTAIPPPPPALEPYKDNQPFDTAIGNFFVSRLVEKPTVTPPPSQASIELAYGCPTLLNWPIEVAVGAPDPCADMKTNASWTDNSDENAAKIVSWSQDCAMFDLANRDASPLVSYELPNGDLLGASQEKTTLKRTIIELRDCQYTTRYTVQERLIHQSGKPDDNACSKYGACDGVVYLQYVMKDAIDKTVAITPYLNLFPEVFEINDAAGNKIATASRAGWDPMHSDCSNSISRHWLLRFAESPAGVFATVTERQWIAQMMTMIALRDSRRGSDGLVTMSECQIFKMFITGLSLLAFLCCACCVPMCCYLIVSAPMHERLHFLEKRWCPRKKKGKEAK